MDETKTLNVKQAAGEIGMSIQWLYRKLKDGSGPPHKRRGRKIIIPRDKLLEWDKQDVIL